MEQIEKILNYKTYTNKRKVDALLEMDCNLYTNLGTDSTKKEREEVKRTSKKIYQAIKSINWHEGAALLYSMDSKN